MKRTQPILAVLGACLCMTAGPLPAQQILVDPDGVGSTDVNHFLSGLNLEFSIVNPVTSPLNINSSELRVGLTERGELRVANGGVLSAREAKHGDGLTTVTGAGSRMTFTNDLHIGANRGGYFNSDFHVFAGAEVEARDVLIGVDSLSTSTMILDGPGSRLTTTGQQIVVGPTSGTYSALNVQAGGSVSTEELVIGATDGQIGSVADVVVDGEGSLVTADKVTVGAVSTGGLGSLWVRGGARVEAESLLLNCFQRNDGTRRVSGAIHVTDGGTLHIESNFRLQTPTLDFSGGTLSLGGDHSYTGLEIGDTNLPSVLNARSGRLSNNETLKIAGHLELATGLTIDGATLSVGSVTNIPGIDLVRGKLELTVTDVQIGAGGAFGDTLTLNADQHVSVLQNLSVQPNGRVELDGGRLGGGVFTNLGLITGDGRIDGAFTNSTAGQVRLASGDQLRFTGASNTNRGEVRLLGDNLLEFDHALTNAAGGVISGRGAIVAGGGVTNQGQLIFAGGESDIEGKVNSSGSIEVLGGGVATFYDDVTSSGDFTLGLGSRAVFFGDADLSGSGSLSVELGQETQGVIGALGSLSVGGALALSVGSNFQPTLGDQFSLASAAGGVTGAFDRLIAPLLPGGLAFEVNVTPHIIEIEVVSASLSGLAGDYNNDGVVDAADYSVWRDNLGSPPGTIFNDTVGGAIGKSQYRAWRENYGAQLSASPATPAPAPEPGSLLVVAPALFLPLATRDRNSRP